MRTSKSFVVDNIDIFKEKLFKWSTRYETSICLDSNNYEQTYSSFDYCIALEEFTAIKTDYTNAFEKLKEYQTITKDYIFGYITYDAKNDIEQLSSKNLDNLAFDDLFFFQPQKIIFINGNQVTFEYLKMVDNEITEDFNYIKNITSNDGLTSLNNNLNIKPRIDKETYTEKIKQVLNHIQQGNIYEANFCQEFYADNSQIDPYKTFSQLNKISKPPFACFMRVDNNYLISASPERYLKKDACKVISQPIKGTAKRLKDKKSDSELSETLTKDEKERSENIMIVDLVRNDLSKTAKKGSVTVEELCKLYSFEQVHQLISTVSAEIEHTTHPVDVIRETFPMGSMTGAPKVEAMKIMERLEHTKRGLYSGTLGYFKPNGDFDFNVIIRSILYNETKKYISYTVGGAITSKSKPEKEYEECLIKASALREVLT